MNSRLQVRRETWSCARCRMRKIKCDGLSRACSSCNAASVDYVGLHPITRQSAPRSIVQYPENEIAALERGTPSIPALLPMGHTPVGNASSTAIPDRSAGLLATTFMDLIVQDFTPSFLGLSEEVPLPPFVVTGTRITSAKKSYGASDIDDRHPRSIINPVPASAPLRLIPVKVADFLFGNYVSWILPQYPVFYEPEIVSLYNSIFHNPSPGCEAGTRVTARASSYTLDEVERYMESFPRFFTTLAERWPTTSCCLEEYERLLAPTKKEYIEYTLQKDNFDWPTPSNLDGFDGIQRDLMDSVASLDDMAYFSTLFDFNGLVEANETSIALTAMPNDWNAEHDFGMQETLWTNGCGSV